ncbi:MAG TPA: tRNA pseudouridine(38-40) synthase TruA [Saprospiraceae bacterium]|nr:tRNA pseudouridine(38-40) synthase TruA [Saprospiraceae bacterium]
MKSGTGTRYSMMLDYDGTNFHGWQVQNQERTVQGVIEKALAKIYQKEITVTGCGRTDAGVHARNYVAHIDLPGRPEFDLKYKLNRMLGDDIAINKVAAVSDDFHARFSATYRQYRYSINGQKMALGRQYSWYCPDLVSLDKTAIEKAIGILEQAESFRPFCKTGSDVKSMVCDVHHAQWIYDEVEDKQAFVIRANRFLRGMVRLIVGSLVLIGRRKLTVGQLQEALQSQNSLPMSYSVPAQGLTLEHVAYPDK